jgi:hypothetical protein
MCLSAACGLQVLRVDCAVAAVSAEALPCSAAAAPRELPPAAVSCFPPFAAALAALQGKPVTLLVCNQAWVALFHSKALLFRRCIGMFWRCAKMNRQQQALAVFVGNQAQVRSVHVRTCSN